jgi:hypothetical protein
LEYFLSKPLYAITDEFKDKNGCFSFVPFNGFLSSEEVVQPEQVYEKLRTKSVSVKEYELKKITSYIAKLNDYKYYEGLLKAYVPQWKEEIKEANFMGRGKGSDSLNTYRKVKIDGKYYFEKVFFNSNSLRNIKWFQTHIYERLNNKINTPKIEKECAGETLTIVYFDFLELIPLSRMDVEDHCIKFSKYFYKWSLAAQIDTPAFAVPNYLKTCHINPHYERTYSLANAKLHKQGIDVEKLKKSINNSRRVLTHGDMNKHNVLENSMIIDWDYFGILPIGFEPAILYFYYSLRSNKQAGNVKSWLEEYYKSTILDEDRKDFELNFLYYLFVFSLSNYGGEHKDLKKELMEALKQKTG